MPFQGNFDFRGPALVEPFDIGERLFKIKGQQMEQEKAKREAQRDIFLNQLTQMQTGKAQQEMESFPEMQAAKLASEKAHAKYWEQGGNKGGKTPKEIAIADALAEHGSPEWKKILQQQIKMSGATGQAPFDNGTSWIRPEEQLVYSKKELEDIAKQRENNSFEKIAAQSGKPGIRAERTRMNQELAETQPLIDIQPELDSFEQLNNQFPNLASDFKNILLKGNEEPGVIQQALKKLMSSSKYNQQEWEALTQMSKIANDLALKLAPTVKGSKGTNLVMKLVQSTKPSPNYPSKTNDVIIKRIREETGHAEEYANELRQGLDYGYSVNRNNKHYRELAKRKTKINRAPTEQASAPQAPGAQAFEQRQAPSDADIQATANKYRITPEEVRRRLGL
jgi:hypothetical protein